MPRIVFAVVVFLLGFSLYVMAAVALADRVAAFGWVAQAAYFLAAGLLWTLPTRQLMVWAARR
jgi:hypothetical protein